MLWQARQPRRITFYFLGPAFRSQTAIIGPRRIEKDMRQVTIKVVSAVAVIATTVMPAASQTPPAHKRAFEVVSIKRNTSGPPRLGPDGLATTPFRLLPGGLFIGNNVPLLGLLSFLAPVNQLEGGPAWINSDRFDIIARADPNDGEVKSWTGGGQDQWKEMIQSLLEDRFKLMMHREMKEISVLALVVGKEAPNFQEYKTGPQGAMQPGPARQVKFLGSPVSALALYLSSALHTTVLDRTGITGLFDYTLAPYQFATLPGDAAPAGPTNAYEDLVVNAVQDQLRLRLEKQKLPVEMTVIDHVEKPSEN
jgi:uncharacterized protein (TIGR03435 family)